MKKNKPVKFSDLNLHCDKLECRQIVVHRVGLEHKSSNTIYFYCPFCRDEVKAYVWSLVGGGKRCDCGALFAGGSGRAYQWREVVN